MPSWSRQLADPLDDVVRGEQAVAPGARAVPRAAFGFALPLGQLLEVRRALRRGHGLDHRRQRREHALRVAHDRHLDRDVLADLGRVDVDVDDAGVRRVRADVAGHPVVEAHAERDQQVGRLDGPVDVLPAVHAHEAVGERVPLVERADAQQRPRDRGVELLGEGEELGLGAGVEDAVAGEDHRALGRRDLGRGELELLVVAVHRRAEAGQAGDDLVVRGVRRLGLPAGARPW